MQRTEWRHNSKAKQIIQIRSTYVALVYIFFSSIFTVEMGHTDSWVVALRSVDISSSRFKLNFIYMYIKVNTQLIKCIQCSHILFSVRDEFRFSSVSAFLSISHLNFHGTYIIAAGIQTTTRWQRTRTKSNGNNRVWQIKCHNTFSSKMKMVRVMASSN